MYRGYILLRVIRRATGRAEWSFNGNHYETREAAHAAADATRAAVDAACTAIADAL